MKGPRETQATMCKICQNKGFTWPAFFGIRTASSIVFNKSGILTHSVPGFFFQYSVVFPMDTRSKLNVYKTFRKHLGRLFVMYTKAKIITKNYLRKWFPILISFLAVKLPEREIASIFWNPWNENVLICDILN